MIKRLSRRWQRVGINQANDGDDQLGPIPLLLGCRSFVALYEREHVRQRHARYHPRDVPSR